MNFIERKILFHGPYFAGFYVEQTENVQQKIEHVFRIIRQVQRVPEKFLKHMTGTDGLYEIRIAASSDIYRIFCCFDKGDLVILFNAFQKKAQKTPRNELILAERLKAEYFKYREHEKGRNKKS